MPRGTFVALVGAYAILFVLSSAWTAWQVLAHGHAGADAPMFPAMSLGALTAVLLWTWLGSKTTLRGPVVALGSTLNFLAVTLGVLAAWFLTG
ncbi:hypothetical protein [Rhodococcus sp. IEGM 1408]|uniref:hypothetical protein n=1 Tax=Rhodococcus sp. IEGM 1408 TaxID=3082220 RepID=UPI002952A5A2|nr:hypothetical protein [Rhodococcus sp. IEGM 1408]MDV8002768.1 hypothetical protein [Rhodococcus sp. IEGM 1408]